MNLTVFGDVTSLINFLDALVLRPEHRDHFYPEVARCTAQLTTLVSDPSRLPDLEGFDTPDFLPTLRSRVLEATAAAEAVAPDGSGAPEAIRLLVVVKTMLNDYASRA